MEKFGIEVEQKWEEVFERITDDAELRKILDDLYLRADRGCEKSTPKGCLSHKNAKLDFLLNTGLVEKRGEQFILSREVRTIIYNLQEYDIQITQGTIRETLKKMAIDGNSFILDVGCGAGQTLIGCLEYHPKKIVGTDIDLIALKLGAYKFSKVSSGLTEVFFKQGTGDRLPFEDNSFTHLICRGVLHKLDIEQGIKEFTRILKYNGYMFLLLPSSGYYIWRLLTDTFNLKHFMVLLFILLNGLIFSLFNLQIKIRYREKIFEEIYISFNKMKKLLKKYGFKILDVQKELIKNTISTYEIIAVRE